jgi:hypothetical protein
VLSGGDGTAGDFQGGSWQKRLNARDCDFGIDFPTIFSILPLTCGTVSPSILPVQLKREDEKGEKCLEREHFHRQSLLALGYLRQCSLHRLFSCLALPSLHGAVIIEMGVKNGPPFLCGNFATGIRCVKD